MICILSGVMVGLIGEVHLPDLALARSIEVNK